MQARAGVFLFAGAPNEPDARIPRPLAAQENHY